MGHFPGEGWAFFSALGFFHFGIRRSGIWWRLVRYEKDCYEEWWIFLKVFRYIYCPQNRWAASGLSRFDSGLSDSPHNAVPGLGLGAVRVNGLYLFVVLAHFASLNQGPLIGGRRGRWDPWWPQSSYVTSRPAHAFLAPLVFGSRLRSWAT